MTSAAVPSSGSSQPGVARGIVMGLMCYLLLTVMETLIKGLSAGYSLPQIVFFRTLFGLVPIAFAMQAAGGWPQLRTRRIMAHLLRGAIGTAAGYLFFYALSVMPLADSYAIYFVAPLFVTVLGVPILGERVDPQRWFAVLTGFAAVMFMLGGQMTGDSVISLGGFAALGGALLYAFAVTHMRRLSRTETSTAIMVYGSMAGLVVSGALLLPPFGYWKPMPPHDLGLMLTVGAVGGLATMCMTQAFRLAPAAVVAPLEYTAMVWAVALGYWIWGDVPSGSVIAGSLAIVACGLYSLHRETRQARRSA